jgi:hypothetical protein
MPPWGWVLVYLAGGSAIGVGGLELTHKSHDSHDSNDYEECPDPGFALHEAEREIEELKKAHESMVESIGMISGLLSQCKQQ